MLRRVATREYGPGHIQASLRDAQFLSRNVQPLKRLAKFKRRFATKVTTIHLRSTAHANSRRFLPDDIFRFFIFAQTLKRWMANHTFIGPLGEGDFAN